MSKYLDDVKKYTDSPNEDAVASLVGHLGIALESRDGSLVAAEDDGEMKVIRENYCSKTLDLDDDQTDKAIAAVKKRMEGDRSKQRVTFYYLLAEEADAMNRLC